MKNKLYDLKSTLNLFSWYDNGMSTLPYTSKLYKEAHELIDFARKRMTLLEVENVIARVDRYNKKLNNPIRKIPFPIVLIIGFILLMYLLFKYGFYY